MVHILITEFFFKLFLVTELVRQLFGFSKYFGYFWFYKDSIALPLHRPSLVGWVVFVYLDRQLNVFKSPLPRPRSTYTLTRDDRYWHDPNPSRFGNKKKQNQKKTYSLADGLRARKCPGHCLRDEKQTYSALSNMVMGPILSLNLAGDNDW